MNGTSENFFLRTVWKLREKIFSRLSENEHEANPVLRRIPKQSHDQTIQDWVCSNFEMEIIAKATIRLRVSDTRVTEAGGQPKAAEVEWEWRNTTGKRAGE